MTRPANPTRCKRKRQRIMHFIHRIEINRKVDLEIRRLIATGFYGASVPEAIERILCMWLENESEDSSDPR